MSTHSEKRNCVLYSGRFYSAEWYYREDGGMPALEYYRELPIHDRVRLLQIIKHLCDAPYGTILPVTLYRIEDRENKIYAFKPRDERFFSFTMEGARVIVTNAYRKHSQQMTKADLESLKTAVRYRNDYLRRLKEGTYYEG